MKGVRHKVPNVFWRFQKFVVKTSYNFFSFFLLFALQEEKEILLGFSDNFLDSSKNLLHFVFAPPLHFLDSFFLPPKLDFSKKRKTSGKMFCTLRSQVYFYIAWRTELAGRIAIYLYTGFKKAIFSNSSHYKPVYIIQKKKPHIGSKFCNWHKKATHYQITNMKKSAWKIIY